MSSLDTLLADVTAQKTQIDSLIVLLSGVKNQLRDALTGEKLSPAAEAKLAAIMPALEANTAEITAAINANTDVAPAPTTTAPTSTTAPASSPAASASTPAPSA